MRTILTALHDIWCAVTARCRICGHDDPLVDELRRHEMAAWRRVGQLRNERAQRTGNFFEDDLFPPSPPRRERP